MNKYWTYIDASDGGVGPVPVARQSEDPYILLPDGTRLYCKNMQGAKAVTAIMRLFVTKQESPSDA
jgi:hypothetical protein